MIKSTLIFGICLLIIDGLWIKFYMKNKYIRYFRSINTNMDVNIVPVIVAYIIMIIAYPLLIENKNKNINPGLIKALAVGLIVFGTYGFTLAAIFPKYDIKFAITETLWGMFLYGLSYLITRGITN
jgi:uncharacterized membrane protein